MAVGTKQITTVLNSYVPIMIALHIFGCLLSLLFFVTSCSLLKKWKTKILVVTISAVLVCDSNVKLWTMIFAFPIHANEIHLDSLFPGLWFCSLLKLMMPKNIFQNSFRGIS